jgi:glycosyltransferase involved in cell wall biosynthesis
VEFILRKGKINLALLWSRYDGGVTSVDDLVLGLDKERFNVIFIYLTGYGVERNIKEEAGYDVFYLSDIKRFRSLRLSILFRLIRILKERNVDILHCHAHKPSFYGALAAMFAKTPVVLSHVHGLNRTRNFKRKLMNLLLLRKFTRIIAVANSVKEDILRSNWSLSTEKLSVLENSVDYKRFADVSTSKEVAKKMLGLPQDVFVFGTAGRLAPTKGLIHLIGAFPKVKELNPSAHLILLGDGPCRAELEQHVSNMSCRDSIHFLGHRDNIEQLLRGMDVFVLSSVAEGMPRVILEVMAAGVPCIASAVGGIPEIITNNETGFLVPSKDEKTLAKAMIAIAKKSEQKIAEIVNRAKELVRTSYSHDEVSKKLEHLYEAELQSSANVKP